LNRVVVKMIEWILLWLLVINLIVVIWDLVKLFKLHKQYPKLIQAYKEGILETNNIDLINEFIGD